MLKKLFNSSTFQFLGESLYLLRLVQGIHLSCWKIRLQAFKRYGVRFDGLFLITIHMGHPCMIANIFQECKMFAISFLILCFEYLTVFQSC